MQCIDMVDQPGAAQVTASIEPTVKQDRVRFEVTITNNGSESVDLRFRSGLEVDVAVMAGDTEVWRWSDGRFFTQALQTLKLAPGESERYIRRWENPSPGDFTAVATLEDRGRSARTTTFITVSADAESNSRTQLDGELSVRNGREGLEFEFTLTNHTDDSVKLVFPDLQTAEFCVFDEGEKIWRTRTRFVYAVGDSSRGQSEIRNPPRTPQRETVVLSAGEKTTFQTTWFDPKPGTYTLTATLLAQSADANAATRVTVDKSHQIPLVGELNVKVGDEVSFEYEVSNTEDELVELTFANRPVFGVRVFDENDVEWQFPDIVLPAVSEEAFEPSGIKIYDVSWDAPDPGEYTAIAALRTSGGIAGATAQFEIASGSEN